MRNYRIGLIVPSSNVAMETEIPELLRRREQHYPERFTFHSARMRMTQVTPEALAAMDAHSERCAAELADAECDALGYACLVAVMASGPVLTSTANADWLTPPATPHPSLPARELSSTASVRSAPGEWR
jgi:maleate cis-trans isomerase